MSAILQSLFEKSIRQFGCRLVNIKWMPHEAHEKKGLLRITIDHPNGVSARLCADVSLQLSTLLDIEDPIACPYQLEVSSPGLFNTSRDASSYETLLYQKIKVTSQVKKGSTCHMGRLVQAKPDGICLQSRRGAVHIPMQNILSVQRLP